MKIAFLKYPAYQKSRANNFEGKSNVGAYVIMDMLKRKGIKCDVVDIHLVSNYDLILISFTSIWDVVSFCRHVYRKSNWLNRSFKVIAGGFGMQSHKNLNGYIDFAYYGRAEDDIHKVFLNLKSKYLYPVSYTGEVMVNKGDKLYPHQISIDGLTWKETLTGCPYKCDFCSYTYTRNFIPSSNNHYFNFYSKKTSVELDFFHYKLYNNQPNVSFGMDGWSERLRYSMNKKISNKLIRQALIHISNASTCKAVRIKLYNIEGYPNESDEDMMEFINNLYGVIPFLRTRLFVIIHCTPLFPSRFTPVENHSIRFDLNLHKRKSFCKYIKHPKLIVEDDNYNPSDAVNMEGIIALRGSRKQFDTIIKDPFYKKLNSESKVKYFSNEKI